MDKYSVFFTEHAAKALKKLKEPILSRILSGIELLADDPLIGKPLVGPLQGKFSYRLGKYRIIYSVENEKLKILIIDIGLRKNVYD